MGDRFLRKSAGLTRFVQQFSPKFWYRFTTLHGITSQKTDFSYPPPPVTVTVYRCGTRTALEANVARGQHQLKFWFCFYFPTKHANNFQYCVPRTRNVTITMTSRNVFWAGLGSVAAYGAQNPYLIYIPHKRDSREVISIA